MKGANKMKFIIISYLTVWEADRTLPNKANLELEKTLKSIIKKIPKPKKKTKINKSL